MVLKGLVVLPCRGLALSLQDAKYLFLCASYAYTELALREPTGLRTILLQLDFVATYYVERLIEPYTVCKHGLLFMNVPASGTAFRANIGTL